MTDLQTQLATLLGQASPYPSLPELVATAEGRLTEKNDQRAYVLSILNQCIPVRHAFTVCTPIQMFKCITVRSIDSWNIRARALIEVWK